MEQNFPFKDNAQDDGSVNKLPKRFISLSWFLIFASLPTLLFLKLGNDIRPLTLHFILEIIKVPFVLSLYVSPFLGVITGFGLRFRKRWGIFTLMVLWFFSCVFIFYISPFGLLYCLMILFIFLYVVKNKKYFNR